MIIIPFFLIAIVPDGFWNGWVIVGFIVCVGGAFAIMKFAPHKENDMPKEYYENQKKRELDK